MTSWAAHKRVPAKPPASHCPYFKCWRRTRTRVHHRPAIPFAPSFLTPTRELAAQVEESVRTYGKYLALRSTVVYGGVDINPQIKALREGIEILVATPGGCLITCSKKQST
jgi:superfamily II DNA/RNA helicase